MLGLLRVQAVVLYHAPTIGLRSRDALCRQLSRLVEMTMYRGWCGAVPNRVGDSLTDGAFGPGWYYKIRFRLHWIKLRVCAVSNCVVST